MARRRKKVKRCHSCGVQATRHVSGNLHVCSNNVCDQFIADYIKAGIQLLKERDNTDEQSNKFQGFASH